MPVLGRFLTRLHSQKTGIFETCLKIWVVEQQELQQETKPKLTIYPCALIHFLFNFFLSMRCVFFLSVHHCVVAERFSGWATWVPPAAIRSKCRKASETIYTFPPSSTFYFFFAFNFIFALEWEGRVERRGKFLLTGNTLEIGNFAFTLIILKRIYYLHTFYKAAVV